MKYLKHFESVSEGFESIIDIFRDILVEYNIDRIDTLDLSWFPDKKPYYEWINYSFQKQLKFNLVIYYPKFKDMFDLLEDINNVSIPQVERLGFRVGIQEYKGVDFNNISIKIQKRKLNNMKHIKYFEELDMPHFIISDDDRKEVMDIFNNDIAKEYNLQFIDESQQTQLNFVNANEEDKVYYRWTKNKYLLKLYLIYNRNKYVEDLLEDIENGFIPHMQNIGYDCSYTYSKNKLHQITLINIIKK